MAGWLVGWLDAGWMAGWTDGCSEICQGSGLFVSFCFVFFVRPFVRSFVRSSSSPPIFLESLRRQVLVGSGVSYLPLLASSVMATASAGSAAPAAAETLRAVAAHASQREQSSKARLESTRRSVQERLAAPTASAAQSIIQKLQLESMGALASYKDQMQKEAARMRALADAHRATPLVQKQSSSSNDVGPLRSVKPQHVASEEAASPGPPTTIHLTINNTSPTGAFPETRTASTTAASYSFSYDNRGVVVPPGRHAAGAVAAVDDDDMNYFPDRYSLTNPWSGSTPPPPDFVSSQQRHSYQPQQHQGQFDYRISPTRGDGGRLHPHDLATTHSNDPRADAYTNEELKSSNSRGGATVLRCEPYQFAHRTSSKEYPSLVEALSNSAFSPGSQGAAASGLPKVGAAATSSVSGGVAVVGMATGSSTVTLSSSTMLSTLPPQISEPDSSDEHPQLKLDPVKAAAAKHDLLESIFTRLADEERTLEQQRQDAAQASQQETRALVEAEVEERVEAIREAEAKRVAAEEKVAAEAAEAAELAEKQEAERHAAFEIGYERRIAEEELRALQAAENLAREEMEALHAAEARQAAEAEARAVAQREEATARRFREEVEAEARQLAAAEAKVAEAQHREAMQAAIAYEEARAAELAALKIHEEEQEAQVAREEAVAAEKAAAEIEARVQAEHRAAQELHVAQLVQAASPVLSRLRSGLQRVPPGSAAATDFLENALQRAVVQLDVTRKCEQAALAALDRATKSFDQMRQEIRERDEAAHKIDYA